MSFSVHFTTLEEKRILVTKIYLFLKALAFLEVFPAMRLIKLNFCVLQANNDRQKLFNISQKNLIIKSLWYTFSVVSNTSRCAPPNGKTERQRKRTK